MARLWALVALTLPVVFGQAPSEPGFDVFDYIDPLIGTTNGGHVFPGATLPFGMAKAVADVDSENQGGYSTGDNLITGLSGLHDDGTGGGTSLGNFPIFPQTGCAGDELNRCYFTKAQRASRKVNSTVKASPGYFAVSLNTSIHAEMTVSNHTALYRFTFPGKAVQGLPYKPLILADLTDLPGSRSNATISVDPSTGRISGNGTFNPSFGVGTYTLHFCADFQGAAVQDTGVFMNNRAGSDPKSLRVYSDGVSSPPVPAGAWVQFQAPANDQILVRVGVSFISVAQACSNAEREIPNFDFKATLSAAQAAWRQKLGVITIDSSTVNKSLQTTFWSGVYRSLISPQDYTGENPLWQSTEPYYDSYYCIWDSFRSVHPLLTILDPHSQTQMIRSLLDIYRHEGYLPDCRMSLCKGFTQGGSNADVVVVDSFVKRQGLGGGIDWATAYEAIVKDAEVQPPVWTVEGRGGLKSWKSLGYIPADDFDPHGVGLFTRSISRTVEYAYNDYCIALMASLTNKKADAEIYLGRSKNWFNLFKPDQTSILNTSRGFVDSGWTGWLQPKYLNGTFGFQDPSLCQPIYNFTSCYLNSNGHETYEGGSWLYTFLAAPHDMATLINALGGPDAFVRRLEYFHLTPNLLYMGDEQAFLLVYLFHYVGRPGLSAKFAHHYIPSQFNDTVAGIPGNDDSGAMGAFSTLAMMGLYPVSGQDVYLITPPFFREVNITNGITGKTATVRSVNFDAGYRNIYVQSVTLNGNPYRRNWITHSFFAEGGVLELVLAPVESTSWGTAGEDLPPSSSTSRTF
ncbi:hypothetical protein MAPG_02975 [Magnaporthiopsis poae ATCC 64411]|uniref:Glycosyl hydrolase n=1 Tax=Magnaporthiopsis poae (strain ATCC 64411 / 73-15) TaxID=644358 RepID=A0A0C4DST4_MAGP6|nr:hypothetical protein MAPG_02975 [Magnaporthiopsis poae ATCC 64411]